MTALLLLLIGCSGTIPVSEESCLAPLTCADDLTAECDGVYTALPVPGPTNCPEEQVTNDIATQGFAVGTEVVTFSTLDGAQSCATQVTITDNEGPDVDCEPTLTVAWTEATDPVTPPAPEISDACDAEPAVQSNPEFLTLGANTVVYEAKDSSDNVSTCTSEVTLLELFAVSDLQVLSATLEEDTRTRVTLGWSLTNGRDTTDLQLEQSDTAKGPWTVVDMLSPNAVNYTLPSLSGDPIYLRMTSVSDDIYGGSSAPIKVFPIDEAGYDVRDVTVKTISFPTTLYGVVRHPADLSQGPFPLVVLLHGNHGNCRPSMESTNDQCATNEDHECPWEDWVTTPNAEGMAYQAETLAAQGYIAVSISGNALNCRDDYILERAELIVEHLRHWDDWQSEDGGPLGATFVGAVDMTRVGLIGHSRGGDAVSHVPTLLQDDPEPGINIESIFAIAATDYHDAEVLDTHYAALLPACDGDVSSLIGREIYDRAVRVDNPVRHAQALYMGANHNFFSTEWAYNDGYWVCSDANMVGVEAQQNWLEATLGPWFNNTLFDVDLRPDMRAEGLASAAVEAWAGQDLDVRWSYSSDDRLLVDDLEGSDSPDTNQMGLSNEFSGFQDYRACYGQNCGQSFDHDRGAIILKWNEDELGEASFGLQGVDASAYPYLSFRISSRDDNWNGDRDVHDAMVRLRDANGNEGTALLSEVQRISHGYETGHVTDVLQTVRIDITKLTALAPDLDLGNLDEFVLAFPVDGVRGVVYVSDVEFSF
jgi:hypothetical protein